MKSRITQWSLGIMLGVLPFFTACVPESTGSAAGTNKTAGVQATTTNPVPETVAPVPSPAVAGVETSSTTPPPDVDLENAEVKPVTDEKPLPADVRLSLPALELVKLAHSGVEESVMLAFATNSMSTFNLTAEQIIYLKDIGVPAPVVTAMIQRDQAIRNASAATPEAPATEMAATAPAPGAAPPAPETNVAAAPPPVVTNVTVNTFYDALAPYGTWVDVDGYGMCWRPTVVVVNPGWRPYYDCGRWVYTDCGWYWYSDYSWGWGPFHYGRWFNHARVGWCWAPGTVWGPSWVTWRYNSAYCGWAPLPPAACYTPGFGFSYYGNSVSVGFNFGLGVGCYSYVPINSFCRPHLPAYGVPPHQVPYIYNQSVTVNNYIQNNSLIVNQGVPPKQITAVTGQPVPRVPIQTATTIARGTRPERFAPNGASLVSYRPVPGQPAYGVRPSTATATSGPQRPVQPVTTFRTAPSSTLYGARPSGAGTRSTPAIAPQNLTAPSQPSQTTAVRPATPAQTRTAPLILRGPSRPQTPASTASGPPGQTVWQPNRVQQVRPTPVEPSLAQNNAVQEPALNQAPAAARGQPAVVPQNTVNQWRPAPRVSTAPASGRQYQVTQPQPAAPRVQIAPAAPSVASPRYYNPGYQAPVRSAAPQPAPAPAYRPAPAPSYSAPTYRPAPAPSYSAPARSAPAAPSFSPPQSGPRSSMNAPQGQAFNNIRGGNGGFGRP